MSVEVEVGYNHRTWVTFEIKDATEEEVATLIADNDDAVLLLAEMDEANRLTLMSTQRDDNPEPFDASVDTSVVGVTRSDG